MDETPVCCECGCELRNPKMCNYDNRRDEFLPPDFQPDHGEFGLQYIGPCCAQKRGIPKSWLIPDKPKGAAMEVVTEKECNGCLATTQVSFRHSPTTGDPEWLCGCGETKTLTKEERRNLLTQLNRMANTLSRHVTP